MISGSHSARSKYLRDSIGPEVMWANRYGNSLEIGSQHLCMVFSALKTLGMHDKHVTQTCQLSRIAQVTPAIVRILTLTRKTSPITRIEELFAHAAGLWCRLACLKSVAHVQINCWCYKPTTSRVPVVDSLCSAYVRGRIERYPKGGNVYCLSWLWQDWNYSYYN